MTWALERFKHVRDDHLRYMQKWGLVRPAYRDHGEAYYSFSDVALIRQAGVEPVVKTVAVAVVVSPVRMLSGSSVAGAPLR